MEQCDTSVAWRLEVENGKGGEGGGLHSRHILKQTRTVTDKVVITITPTHNDAVRAVADSKSVRHFRHHLSVLHYTECKSRCVDRDEEEGGFEFTPINERMPKFRCFHTFTPRFVAG